MRVVVVGATGNIGTSVLRALADEPAVESVLGLARRLPDATFAKTTFAAVDIVNGDLAPHFRGAAAVVHLAWLIQPSRDRETLRRVNVDGSQRVLRAAAEAGVGALVCASSIGAYSRGPKDRTVAESWPTDGVHPSWYSRHKVELERRLDRLEAEAPSLRVVRIRNAFTMKRESASEVRRLWAGPFLPNPLMRPRIFPFVPNIPGLRFQLVHSDDVGEAYRLAIVREASGAFNIAAEPPLEPRSLAQLLRTRLVPVPRRLARAVASLAWRAHVQPTSPDWLDLALAVPLLDTTRARTELGWSPSRSGGDTFLEFIAGLLDGAGIDTPPLSPKTGGPLRAGELAGGVGEREGH